MNFSTEEINEFKAEALELLDDAERSLLALDAGALLKNHYDSIFRVFHSLKGGAGMLGLTPVQSHMHQLETQYQKLKGTESIAKELITYFLKGVDAARQLLEGKNISFDYSESEATKSEIKPETKTDSVIETKSLATVPSNNRQNAPAPLGDRPRIFVIDDEKDIVDILSEAIQEAGFEPIGFTNPIEAIQNLKKFKPDAVLTDMKMPEASGFEVLQTVRQLNDELPVIFISGHMTKEMVLDAIHKGAFSILEKPFSIAASAAWNTPSRAASKPCGPSAFLKTAGSVVARKLP